MSDSAPLLEVSALAKHFPIPRKVKRRGSAGTIRAVDELDFSLDEGSTLALVGESGCGKTTTARLILRLERPTSGSIKVYGEDINRLTGSGLRRYRSLVQAVFQDPYTSLNPRMQVGAIIAEPLRIHGQLSRRSLVSRVSELLEQVGLSGATARSYPHQFSGGQRQRVAVARALALNPRLIILDEPVSALDVSIRAQILNLLADLQERLKLSYLLISHDLGTVEHMSEHVAVMYAGRIVELAATSELYRHPAHPYTKALLAAVPQPNPDIPITGVIKGDAASLAAPDKGCRFSLRCPHFEASICDVSDPPLIDSASEHWVACFKAGSLEKEIASAS